MNTLNRNGMSGNEVGLARPVYEAIVVIVSLYRTGQAVALP
jgi:hypothetical protein